MHLLPSLRFTLCYQAPAASRPSATGNRRPPRMLLAIQNQVNSNLLDKLQELAEHLSVEKSLYKLVACARMD